MYLTINTIEIMLIFGSKVYSIHENYSESQVSVYPTWIL